VCIHNAGRFQKAAALLNQLANGRIEVRSAGTEPADHINPVAITAVAELGIDITAATPTVVTSHAVQTNDVVITMGCGDRTAP
jgi:arsenate reductase (thioredoxin)